METITHEEVAPLPVFIGMAPAGPLGLLSEDGISEDQLRILRNLEEFEAPFLKEKLAKDGKFEGDGEFAEAFFEWKRYVALSVLCRGVPLSMASTEVDEVWHYFILFTREYRDFCHQVLGRFLHHSPNVPSSPMSSDARGNLVRNYRKHFGRLAPLWARAIKEKRHEGCECDSPASKTKIAKSNCNGGCVCNDDCTLQSKKKGGRLHL